MKVCILFLQLTITEYSDIWYLHCFNTKFTHVLALPEQLWPT